MENNLKYDRILALYEAKRDILLNDITSLIDDDMTPSSVIISNMEELSRIYTMIDTLERYIIDTSDTDDSETLNGFVGATDEDNFDE